MKYTRHSMTDLRYHLVICPKYRKKITNDYFLKVLNYHLKKEAKRVGFDLIEYSIQEDHIHMHFECGPTEAISTMIGKFKSGLTKELLIAIPPLIYSLNKNKAMWSRGYYLSSTGIDSEAVQHYIKNQ